MTEIAPDFASLLPYLPPALTAHLATHRDLPPLVRAGLATQLRDTLIAYAAHIPDPLLRKQLQNPEPGRVGGAFWKGSLLFADLSGFTMLSEQLSVRGRQGAEEISAVVNWLFDALVAEVDAYQGTLLTFGGDALTVFFDAALVGADHAAAATSAALAMQRRMNAFAALQTHTGKFQLRLRVGVHSGQIFAAEVGDASHIELVVTGLDMSRVAMAQEQAAPGEVVISNQTASLLEGARLVARGEGFQKVDSLLYFRLPPRPPNPLPQHGPDDIATLTLLARQVAGIQPYLVRNLPRRFLSESTATGEFRPVSVLFANVQGWSEMLGVIGQDAPRAAQGINAYYRRAQQIVHHYDGNVNKVDLYTRGNKLMVLFGAPNAHEDDPLRAVRCALDLRIALQEANEEIVCLLGEHKEAVRDRSQSSQDRFSLLQRIGITTGSVFAGQVGGAHRHEYTVMGPAVNLASRLMEVATYDTTLVSPTTRAAVSRHINLRDQPPVQLKGLAAPIVPAQVVGVYADVRPKQAVSSNEIARSPLVGRSTEVSLLRMEAQTAICGQGRVIALVGEAGVGKTRLVQEVLRHMILLSGGYDSPLPEFDSFIVESHSYERNTPYATARQLLQQLLTGDLHATSSANIIQQVRDLVPEMADDAPLLDTLLDIEFDDTPVTAGLSLEQRYSRSHELVVALLQARARLRPCVVIVDDLHWADASSLDLVAHLAAQIGGSSVFLILGYRPDPAIDEPWAELNYCKHIAVSELSPEHSTALLRGLLHGDLPEALEALIDQTQGNPFFVEEAVRSLLESGTLERGQEGWRVTRPITVTSIPDSIEGVITARLDRLDDDSREVIQVASVIGRRFPHQILAKILAEQPNLSMHLNHLAKVGLIVTEQVTREITYVFKHALTREVAYGAILYARRRELHRRVAREIERLHSESDAKLGLLAYHYTQAEEWELAFHYQLAAGRQAQEHFANREALTFFEGARHVAAQLTE